jgi:hypothetical protein
MRAYDGHSETALNLNFAPNLCRSAPMNLPLLVLFLASVAADVDASQPRAKVCSGMKVELIGVSIEGVDRRQAEPSSLHPGDCAVPSWDHVEPGGVGCLREFHLA